MIDLETMKEELRGYSALDPKIIAFMRSHLPRLIAEELVGVQPIDPGPFQKMIEFADKRTPEEMRADGFEPIDGVNGLLWIKKHP